MHRISSKAAVRLVPRALGVAGIAGLLMGASALLGSHPAAAATLSDGSPPMEGSPDVRQSPYYKGYDFYYGAKGQGTYGDGEIHPWHVQGNIWLLAGEPGESNVAVQIGNDGGLVVDTGTQEMAPKLLAAIQRLLDEHGGDQKAIRWVVDTDGQMDHVGGNDVIRNGGNTIVGGNFQFDNPGLTPGATVIASLNVQTHMVTPDASGKPSAPEGLWPNETHTEDLYSWDFNDEAVMIHHPSNANTDGNEMVLFRRSDVIATGDVVDMTKYPYIDLQSGGTIDGELAALNQVIELAVADFHNGPQEGGTMVIPGHGRLCDQADVIEYTIIVTTVRNRVMYYKNQGKTLQQVLALKPSWDFDDRWGPSSGPWTANQFVEAVYKSLPTKGKASDRFSMNAPAGG
jgi:glyoxylase-like metal-dependent hydrolase (beta-lactamase superfamily II)